MFNYCATIAQLLLRLNGNYCVAFRELLRNYCVSSRDPFYSEPNTPLIIFVSLVFFVLGISWMFFSGFCFFFQRFSVNGQIVL